MKKAILFVALCAFGAMMTVSCSTMTSKGTQPKTISSADVDSVSYMLGYSFGMQLNRSNFGPLNGSQIVKGIQAATAGEEIDYADFQRIVDGFMEKRMTAITEENKAESQKALDAFASEEGVVVTESGLHYKIVKEGEGAKPAEADTVEVNYEGKNLKGEVFDSSYERGETTTFPLNRVIKGWTEGIQLIGEGGEIELLIPAELAYGNRGAGEKIGPEEALRFKVELVSVKPVAKAEEAK